MPVGPWEAERGPVQLNDQVSYWHLKDFLVPSFGWVVAYGAQGNGLELLKYFFPPRDGPWGGCLGTKNAGALCTHSLWQDCVHLFFL